MEEQLIQAQNWRANKQDFEDNDSGFLNISLTKSWF